MIGSAGAILSVRRICKTFGPVRVLHDVDFDLNAGAVHALVGENGAGKTTLARIIAGTHRDDGGGMTLNGQSYRPAGRTDAQRRGVRMVMQELNLFPTLTVAENIFLEDLPRRFGVINYRLLHRRAEELMAAIGLRDLAVDEPVGNLTVGSRQMVEIAAGLSQDCRLLILDEPTASLTDRETCLLFDQIRRLRARGVAMLYISHRMQEIKQIADTVTVLRDGRIISTHAIDTLTVEEIVNRMVGREISHAPAARTAAKGRVALRVENLCAGPRVQNISFDLHKGEVLGLAGLIGAGRTETVRAIFGADRLTSGRIYLGETAKHVRIRSPRDAIAHGIALIPEDRKEQGLFLPLGVDRNIAVPNLSRLSCAGIISPAAERTLARRHIDTGAIKCAAPDQPAETLSGGNQQKVVIAKWLARDCDVLIFDEPTRGIDVGAKFEIYAMMADLAARGKALIVVSSDLRELMAICDRIAVLSDGCLAATFSRNAFSEQTINAAAFSRHTATFRTQGAAG
ncbi:MAG: sugar ABC transporter ATP-binding protein [Phycisphaerae bacterium]|nr:sugar ABC transporter ATP-binding protein [Phycisphaerae bacterium]